MSDRPKKKEPYKCSTKGCATMIAGNQSYEVCHACVARYAMPEIEKTADLVKRLNDDFHEMFPDSGDAA